MSHQYRVALIGCGGRAREHMPGLLADARCQIVALADVKRESAEAMNADFGLALPDVALYTDHRAMLAEAQPEVVISCLWTPLHLPVFRDCVEAGVRAVLSEKPMAPTWGESREIGRLAEKSGTLLTFCHQRRFSSGNRLVRRLIAEGRFGTIERMDLYSPPNLLDCGTHTFDQALSFNNESPARWALGAVDVSETLNWFGVRAEGMATGTIVFENGVRAALQVGGPDRDMSTGVRVIGSDGFIEATWDGEIKRAIVYSDPHWQLPSVETERDEMMRGVIRNALDCLESGAEPELSYRKALRAAEIIFALYESVRRHTRIPLPLADTFSDNPFITMLETGALGAAS